MAEVRFEGSGPVARYWLANCKGFSVTGGARGVVEQMLRDADPHVTTRLVVRTRSRRRRVVPAEAVAMVVPAERTLVVAPRRPPGHAARRSGAAFARASSGIRAGCARAAAAAAPVASSTGRRVGTGTRRGWNAARLHGARAAAATAPLASSTGRRVGAGTRRGWSAARLHGGRAAAAAVPLAETAGRRLASASRAAALHAGSAWEVVRANVAALVRAIGAVDLHGRAAHALRRSFVVLAAEARATARMVRSRRTARR